MNILKKNIDVILLAFILLFFIGDAATSIIYKLPGDYFSRYSGIIKLVLEALMCIIILQNIKKQYKLIIGLIALTVSFLISQIILDDTDYNLQQEFLAGNIYFFNRYIYISIFILFTRSILIKQETFKKVYTFLEYFLYINAVAMVCGFLFDIEIFRSYEYTERFGFSGFLPKPGEASFLYIIVIICNYYFWLTTKETRNLYKMIFFIFFALFLGQKKMILFLTLLGAMHFMYYNKYRKVYRIVLPLTFVVMLVFRNAIVERSLQRLPFWNSIYEKDGFMSMLFSYRNKLLEQAIEFINSKWTIYNYFFGGVDFYTFKIEFEFIDLYLFLGIPGVIYYIFIVMLFISQKHALVKKLIFITFLTSFLSGGLILNVTAIILFYIAIEKVMISDYGYQIS